MKLKISSIILLLFLPLYGSIEADKILYKVMNRFNNIDRSLVIEIKEIDKRASERRWHLDWLKVQSCQDLPISRSGDWQFQKTYRAI